MVEVFPNAAANTVSNRMRQVEVTFGVRVGFFAPLPTMRLKGKSRDR